jgi:error-prone DNA polymerase
MLAERGVRRAHDLARLREGARVRVAGAVICRQRPGTAKGFVFLTLEDETGLVNITIRPDLFEAQGQVVVTSEVLEIDGILQTHGGVSVRATEVRRPVLPPLGTTSRDFH